MIRCGVAGAGYFSQYHVDAWLRLDEVELVAIADIDTGHAAALAGDRGIAVHADVGAMLDAHELDVLDIVTPPETHMAIATLAAERGIHVICQKPLAPTAHEAAGLIEMLGRSGARFMVHENWRWQPWYRSIHQLIRSGATGVPFNAVFTMRTGDGWQPDAYLDRQPYFREYPRLLLFETGVHFVDTYRFLFGEVASVYAQTRRHNTVIAGEDAALCVLTFASGAIATLDANRFNEPGPTGDHQRYTFGSMRVDAERGHVLMTADGVVTWTKLGGEPVDVLSNPPRAGFGGDSVHALQRHFIEQLLSGEPFESEGADYLRTIDVIEACYESARTNSVVTLSAH